MIRTESGDEGGEGVCGRFAGGDRTRMREICSSSTKIDWSMQREASISSEDEFNFVKIEDGGSRSGNDTIRFIFEWCFVRM